MRRFGAFLGVLVTLFLAFSATPAHAAPNHRYTSYEQQVTLSKNGTATVVLNAELNFGSDPGHGPLLTFITRQKMNDGRYRLLDTEILSVTSSTGANTNTSIKRTTNTLTLRIGREGTRYTGRQRYTITYRITGLITPNHPQSKLDEFNWNAIGTAGNTPHRNVKVTITGPGAPTKGACWQGSDFRTACQSTVSDEAVVLQTASLHAGEPLQVVAGYPVGTFVDAEPRYHTPKTLKDMFPLDPVQFGAAGVVAAGGIGGVMMLGRRGRDRVYAGVAPGNRPNLAQASTATMFRDEKDPVAVRFTPPNGISPAEGDFLLNRGIRPTQTSATLIDLAVRGYLKIEANAENEFTFLRTGRSTKKGETDLKTYERKLVSGLFKGANKVTTQRLKSGKHGPVDRKMRESLNQLVVKGHRWFNRDPLIGIFLGIGLSLLVILAGAGLAVLLGFALGWGWLGVAVVVVGIAVLTQAKRFTHRTPEGSAILAQVKGFKKYISTAEADQLRWEEGQDIYSAYLPWAIAFDQADRWTGLFQQLAADGRYDFEPTWFVSPYHSFWYGNLWSDSFTSFTSAIQNSISQSESMATSGSMSSSSGFSGFSGGGGFGGGGSGSW